MSSIALFPCTFTPVDDVIKTLQGDLNLKIYDDNALLAEAASQFQVEAERLKKGMYGRLSVFNQFTLEKEKTINMLRSVVANRLNTPDRYLFNGLLTSLIPPQVSHVLRVLIVDEKQARISRAITAGMSEDEAKKKIRNDDISAFGWTDFLFQKEAYDRSLYDLVIPLKNLAPKQLVEEISKCYHKTAVLHTTESQRGVHNLLLETEVERVLLLNGTI